MANTTGKKFGGRKKGIPNRLTKELRLVLKEVVFNQLETLEDHFSQLDPIHRVELLIKLLPYVVPKVRNERYDLNEPLDYDI